MAGSSREVRSRVRQVEQIPRPQHPHFHRIGGGHVDHFVQGIDHFLSRPGANPPLDAEFIVDQIVPTRGLAQLFPCSDERFPITAIAFHFLGRLDDKVKALRGVASVFRKHDLSLLAHSMEMAADQESLGRDQIRYYLGELSALLRETGYPQSAAFIDMARKMDGLNRPDALPVQKLWQWANRPPAKKRGWRWTSLFAHLRLFKRSAS